MEELYAFAWWCVCVDVDVARGRCLCGKGARYQGNDGGGIDTHLMAEVNRDFGANTDIAPLTKTVAMWKHMLRRYNIAAAHVRCHATSLD